MSSRLQDLDFQALLPSSIAEDPAMRAAATSLNATLRATALAIPNLLIYARLGAAVPDRRTDPTGDRRSCPFERSEVRASRAERRAACGALSDEGRASRAWPASMDPTEERPKDAMLPPLARLTQARGGLASLSEGELEQLAWQFHVDFRETARNVDELATMTINAIPWHRIKGTPASLKAALGLFGYGVASPPGTAAGRADRPEAAKPCPYERSELRASRAAMGAQRKPRFSQATDRPEGREAWPSGELASLTDIESNASAPQDAGPSGIIIEEDGTGRWWATYQLGLPQIADTATVRQIVRICTEMAPARCRLWRIYTDAFDRRPIILSHGPVLGDGWLTFYSGAPVPVDPDNPDSDNVIVSFGTRNGYQSEPYAVGDVCGSFGATTWYGFLAPYLDRFLVGRSKLSDVYPRNHGFFMGSLFSILWADRATTGRRWSGCWDARRWLDYTGFDRKLPQWRMERRAASRAQLVPGWGEALSDHNARLGAAFAAVIDNPPRLGAFALSGHDPQRRVLRLHEMFIHASGLQTPAVSPAPRPPLAGAARLSVTCPVPNPVRAPQARQDTAALRMDARQAPALHSAALLSLCVSARALNPEPAPPAVVTAYRAPLWSGAWTESDRTWTTPKQISIQ